MGAHQSSAGSDIPPSEGRGYPRGEHSPRIQGSYRTWREAQKNGMDGSKKNSKAKPTPPGKIQIVEITHSSVSLSWIPPRHHLGAGWGGISNHVIAYTVEMVLVTSRPSSDADGECRQQEQHHSHKHWKTGTKSCQGTNYTVRHLQPNCDYVFRVRAENVNGTGKPSATSEVVTTHMYESVSGLDTTIGVEQSSSSFNFSTSPYHHPCLPSSSATSLSPKEEQVGSDNSLDSTDNLQQAPRGQQTSLKRRHSFNMHLEGGVSKILNNSDIVISNPTNGNHHGSRTSLTNSTSPRYSTNSLEKDGQVTTPTSTIQRHTISRTSLQSNRKISLPILLPGTGTQSINRLQESRNSLRNSVSDYQVGNSRSSADLGKSRSRESRGSVCSSTHSSEINSSRLSVSGDDNTRPRSRSSCHSDLTLSNSRDGSRQSLCDSNLSHDSNKDDSSATDEVEDAITSKQTECNNNLTTSTNSNNNNNNNNTNKEDICFKEVLDENAKNQSLNLQNVQVDADDDIYKLKDELKNFEITEEKLKYHDLKHNGLHGHISHNKDSSFSQTDSQKGYYESLENPWERDTTRDGVSERIMSAPFCDDIKMALYARDLPDDARPLPSPSCWTPPANHVVDNEGAQDFRTLRSVLQSNNMFVKAQRFSPDVVGVVMGEGGEARTLTRGRLTTIVDAEEEEDPVRVTTL